MNYRRGAENYENMPGWQKAMYWLPAGLSSFASGLENFLAPLGLDNLMSSADRLTSNGAAPTSPIQYTSAMIRGEAESISPVLAFAYDFGTAAANLAPSILLSTATSGMLGAIGAPAAAARIAGMIPIAAPAAGNAYVQKVREGYTPEQAGMYSTLVGVSSAVLQYLIGGIAQLGGVAPGQLAAKISHLDNAIARVSLTAGVYMGFEAVKDVLREILQPLYATILLDEDYEIDFGSVAYSALMGAVMGGLFSAREIMRAAQPPPRPSEASSFVGYLDENGTDHFEGCGTPEAERVRLRELSKRYHPDTGANPDAEIYRHITKQYNMRKAWHQGGALRELQPPRAPIRPRTSKRPRRRTSTRRRRRSSMRHRS